MSSEWGTKFTRKNRVVPPHMSYLTRFLLYRINRDMEAYVMITGKSGVRGKGKTAAAISIAKFIHRCSVCSECEYVWLYQEYECPRCGTSEPEWTLMPAWTHEKNAAMNTNEYRNICRANEREVMVFDEVEKSADKRRAMSDTAVILRWLMQVLRVQNNIMIMTLPTAKMLDGDIEALTDIWCNVNRRGDMDVYHLWINDFPPYRTSRIRAPIPEINGYEVVHWQDLDDDEDYQQLAERKYEMMDGFFDEKSEEEIEKEADERIHKNKIELCETLLENTDMNQTEIGEEVGDYSQAWVSEVNKGYKPEQDEDDDKYPIR